MKKDKESSVPAWLDLLSGTLNHGAVVELPMLSGSMVPVLIPEKKVKIKYLSVPDVHTGDIIVLKDGNTLTAHRLLIRFSFCSRRFFYQKGDNNRFGSWINRDQIIGIVTSAQDISDEYIDLTSPVIKKQARSKVFKQLIIVCWNILLIIPRGLKGWLKKN